MGFISSSQASVVTPGEAVVVVLAGIGLDGTVVGGVLLATLVDEESARKPKRNGTPTARIATGTRVLIFFIGPGPKRTARRGSSTAAIATTTDQFMRAPRTRAQNA